LRVLFFYPFEEILVDFYIGKLLVLSLGLLTHPDSLLSRDERTGEEQGSEILFELELACLAFLDFLGVRVPVALLDCSLSHVVQ